MAVKKLSPKAAAETASKSATKTPGRRPFSRSKASTKTATRGGRERRNVLVSPALLQGAMAALGTTNMSETVNVALARLAEDAAVLRGIDAATGAIPDFPYLDT